MPAIKKPFNRYEPPSPSLVSDDGIEETFLSDIEQIHDKLPQPFRRIDKVVWDIFEDAWCLIKQHENEKSYKQSTKLDLPKIVYDEELVIRENIISVAACDGFLFTGSKNKITVYELTNIGKVATYEWTVDASDKTQTVIEKILIVANADEFVILLAVSDAGLFILFVCFKISN